MGGILRGSFDAVICDLKMPGRDGLSVLKMLREQHSHLAQRFLLMTGNLADADQASDDLQGIPILPKPFSLQQLRTMIAELVMSAKKEPLRVR